MKNCTLFYLLLLFSSIPSFAQVYSDHFGTGNNIGVTAMSSPVQNSDSIQSTLHGTGYLVDSVGAYRFLAQAGFGGNQEEVDSVLSKGITEWMDWQMDMPYTTYFDTYNYVYNDIISRMDTTVMYNAPTDTLKFTRNLTLAFYQKMFTDKDVLRQKTAFALSQIFVISLQSPKTYLQWWKGDAHANYYDILHGGAFGNFRKLLEKITLNPIMGEYLTYFENKKADEDNDTAPDENFAREIMQLFTIGLHKLNNDGTLKRNSLDEPIPTYDTDDIKELAKVFTGLYAGGLDTFYNPNPSINAPFFGMYRPAADYNVPMIMSQENHETSIKYLPDGTKINENQAGMEDINQALDWLFMHENTPPFISYRLIQQLVKSNPTPGYVNRVAMAFKNNGKGERGDLGAVIRAILTDPEARDCEWIDHPTAGKLLQPMERYLNLFKALEIQTPSGRYFFLDHDPSAGEYKHVQQAFLYSPSVFNFFSPSFAESTNVEPEGLVSPEFQILNSITGIGYLNRIEWCIKSLAKN